METDKLKEHIDRNRPDFEIYDFEPGNWDSLAETLEKREAGANHNLFYGWWKIASMILLAVGLFAFWQSKSNQNAAMIENSDWLEAKNFYGEKIAVQQTRISRFKDNLDDEIFEDIEALDEAFRDLKKDLKENVDNEEVVSAMIKNYKIKIEVLERILNQIENKESKKGS